MTPVQSTNNTTIWGNSKVFLTDNTPFIAKILSTNKPLSIQVHPDKTEVWYIINCEIGAYIYCGFKYTVTKSELLNALQQNKIESLLNKIYIKPGNLYIIPAGTIHSISAGITLAEVQENSDITYRLYDYNRNRELHINDALKVLNYNSTYNFKYQNNYNIIIGNSCSINLINNQNITYFIPNKNKINYILNLSNKNFIQNSNSTQIIEQQQLYKIESLNKYYTLLDPCNILLIQI